MLCFENENNNMDYFMIRFLLKWFLIFVISAHYLSVFFKWLDPYYLKLVKGISDAKVYFLETGFGRVQLICYVLFIAFYFINISRIGKSLIQKLKNVGIKNSDVSFHETSEQVED